SRCRIRRSTLRDTYDYLHRLTSATATDGTWGEAYTYDGFGNLTSKTPTQGSAPVYNGSTGSNATNGVLGWGFDMEQRVVAVQNGPYYVYDPWGRRVWSQTGDGTVDQTHGEAFFYSAAGQKLETYSFSFTDTGLSTALEGTNTYFGGKMLS